MFVSVATLPIPLQNILTGLDYHKKDIEVKHVTTVNLSNSGSGDGTRAFSTIVNISDFSHKTFKGSWGGQNMFNLDNPVDMDNRDYALEPGMLAITGIHWTHPTLATIYAHKDSAVLPLETGETLSKDILDVLAVFTGIKGGYRKEYLARIQGSSAIVADLLEKGHLKANKAGAVQITTSGKNAVGSHRFY